MVDGPVIVPGDAGVVPFTFTARFEPELTPHEFPAVTERLPPVVPAFTVTETVLCPLMMVHPAGTVQL